MAEKQRYHLLPWLSSFRVARFLFLVLVFMIGVAILINCLVVSSQPKQPTASQREARLKRDQQFYQKYSLHDFKEIIKNDNLEQRLDELFKIRESILNELVYLEQRRQKQQDEINNYALKVDEIKAHIARKQNELSRVHLSLEQAEYSRKEVVLQNRPFIASPLRIVDDVDFQVFNLTISTRTSDDQSKKRKRCSMHHCFDYSRCPLTKNPPYVYLERKFLDNRLSDPGSRLKDPSDVLSNSDNQNDPNDGSNDPDEFLKLFRASLNAYCDTNFDLVDQADRACLVVIPILSERQVEFIPTNLTAKSNVLIVNFGLRSSIEQSPTKKQQSISDLISENTMIVQSDFNENAFRRGFDIILPSLEFVRENYRRSQQITSTFKRYLHCPAKRKYLISCVTNVPADDQTNQQLVRILNGIFQNSLNSFDAFHLEFNYSTDNSLDEHLAEVYSQSTFSLLLPHSDPSVVSAERLNQQLAAILSTSSIPVLLGDYQVELPFSEVVDWSLAVVRLPLARVSELHLVLKSINDNDLLKMRKHGRLFYDRYLSKIDPLIASLFSILTAKRLQLPLRAIRDDVPNRVYSQPERPMSFYELNTEVAENANEIDENLGPIEPAFASSTYQRNYTLVLTESYALWNSDQLNPFFMFPHSPFDPILPSEAKFVGSSYGFRPIQNGLGGSGREFSENIGGNYPKEQFTIVMLTFERESVLMDSLQRLKGLPYLNKIVIVWNANRMPENRVKWPNLGVEIVVVKAEKNSLNNRFRPYDVIETEAILSMDDDVHLRHDEIVFGFRVWRESREKIVGFPGRYHAWYQNEWMYNSNYSCELSMVLTGAAFFHKVSFWVFIE